MNYDRAELLDRLACDYVLGTMGTRARRRFRSLSRRLPAAHRAVEAWSNRLNVLSVESQLEPSPAVWDAIKRRIDGSETSQRAAPSSPFWSWLKPAAGFAAGAFLTWGLVVNYPTLVTTVDDVARVEETLPQSYVGVLTDDNGAPVVVASSARHGAKLTIKLLRELPPPSGKQWVLWALPQDGSAPFVLGIVPVTNGEGELMMVDTSEKLLSNVNRLAMSAEPIGRDAVAPSSALAFSGAGVKLWKPPAQPAARPGSKL